MPGREFRTAMDVGSLVNFILFKPPAHAAGNSVPSVTRKIAVIQFNECVTEQCTFCWIYGPDVAPDAISECHINLQFGTNRGNFIRERTRPYCVMNCAV